MFCPNCRSWNSAKSIFKFQSKFKELIYFGLEPYFLTLTVPNVSGENLENEISNINKSFRKLWKWTNGVSSDSNKRKFQKKLFSIMGAIKMIEITVNKKTGLYHLHLHAIVFLKDVYKADFVKDFPGGYQHKTDRQIYYSNADIFIQKLWTMAYKNINLKDFSDFSDDSYICDIREIELGKGIFEVFKYAFKDMDIDNIEVFSGIFFAFRNRRLRQGYGMLYGINKNGEEEEEMEDEIKKYLEVDPEEGFKLWRTNKIMLMVRDYSEYKKISRFNRDKEYMNIKD